MEIGSGTERSGRQARPGGAQGAPAAARRWGRAPVPESSGKRRGTRRSPGTGAEGRLCLALAIDRPSPSCVSHFVLYLCPFLMAQDPRGRAARLHSGPSRKKPEVEEPEGVCGPFILSPAAGPLSRPMQTLGGRCPVRITRRWPAPARPLRALTQLGTSAHLLAAGSRSPGAGLGREPRNN